jgi:protein TonB
MKAAIPLFEFMPYGAPELLESRQRLMARALFLTSLLALATFSSLGGLLPRLRAGVETRVPRVEIWNFEPRAPRWVEPAPPPALPRVASPRAPASGVPVPVPVPAPPPVLEPVAGAGAVGAGPAAPTPAAAVDEIAGPAPPPDDDVPVAYVEDLPEPAFTVTPAYSEFARSAEAEGLVIVQVLVGRDGRVREARLDQRHHVPLLDEEALEAARRWVFTPARVNGHPVATWTAIPFRFTLR